MEKITAFVKSHPVETALLGGVALIALYFAFAGSGSSDNGAATAEANLQNSYFQAEAIQAQAGASEEDTYLTTQAQTAQTQIAANVQMNSDNVWSQADVAMNASNNATATAALPYAEESNLIDALAGIASQTTTTQTTKNNSGFFGIGGGSSTTTKTASTAAAISASNYLNELANGFFTMNG